MANRTVSVILQAEIGQYVSGMAKAALATKSVGESAEAGTKQAGKGFDLAGRGAQLFGLAVAGALVGVVAKSMEFEKAMSGVQAATQATAATMGDLRAVALKAGADTQYSATEAAQGITEMAKAGVSAKDIMGGGLQGALNLAAAGQLDVAAAAGIASTAMTQFNLHGSDLPHVADLLAAGAGKAMGSVDDMGQALNQAGLLASSTGISIEETTGTLAAFASAGLIGSDAGTSFKTMLQQLQAPSQQSAALMQQLGINAYDAQGNFVGLAGLAQQLHNQLGGLTQAQRDNALATIFGTDAARAATVLYREGAAGIKDWTAKVNDAGYAQQQASQLTDNLAGDLERLGGSFDTLLISIGSGMQGPLRGLTQMLGGLVDGAGSLLEAFGKLPGPVQAALAAFAGWAAVGDKVIEKLGPVKDALSSGWDTFTGAISGATQESSGFGDTISSLAQTGWDAAKGGLKELAKAIGPELGMAAATYAATSAADSFMKIVGAGSSARDEIDKFNESLKHIDTNAGRIDALAQHISDLQQKIQDLNNNPLQDAAFDPGNPLGLGAMIGALKDGRASADEYQAALAQAEARQNLINDSADGLATKMGMTRDEVLKLADAAGVDLSNGIGSAYGQLLLYRDSQDAANGSTQAASSTMQLFSDQMTAVKDAADGAKKATDQFQLSLDILTGKQISLNQVESAYYAALDSAKGALDGLNGRVVDSAGNLDLSTEAGRKTNDILTNLAQTSNQYIATLVEQGATTDQAQAKDAELRKSFYDTALQMTGSKSAAENLTNSIFGIPTERTTQINADVGAAQNAIANTQAQIDNLHGKTITITMTATGTVAAILGDPSAHSGRVGPVGYAGGGYTGAGAKYQPAGIVHAGEVVFSQEDVAAHGGVGAVEMFRTSRVRGYADGGAVIQINTDDSSVAASVASARSAVSKMMASSAPGVGGSVDRWRPIILRVLSELGISPAALNGVMNIIRHESGGNPTAINLTDSNARAGHPSQGLMQTIPGTFNAYAGPYRSLGITNPLANIYAGINYALHRYGAAWLTRGGNTGKLGGYAGYAAGTDFVPETDLALLHKSEAVLNPREAEAYRAGIRSRETSGGSAGGWGGGSAPTVNITGAKLSGTLMVNGLEARMEAVVVDALTTATNRRAYNG